MHSLINQNSIALPLRMSFYSKAKYGMTYTGICFGCLSWLGGAAAMTNPTPRNGDQTLDIFIGVAQLFAITFEWVSESTLMMCCSHLHFYSSGIISRFLPKESEKCFSSPPPQLNVEGHLYPIHREWAAVIRKESILLCFHLHCKDYTKKAFQLYLIILRW